MVSPITKNETVKVRLKTGEVINVRVQPGGKVGKGVGTVIKEQPKPTTTKTKTPLKDELKKKELVLDTSKATKVIQNAETKFDLKRTDRGFRETVQLRPEEVQAKGRLTGSRERGLDLLSIDVRGSLKGSPLETAPAGDIVAGFGSAFKTEADRLAQNRLKLTQTPPEFARFDQRRLPLGTTPSTTQDQAESLILGETIGKFQAGQAVAAGLGGIGGTSLLARNLITLGTAAAIQTEFLKTRPQTVLIDPDTGELRTKGERRRASQERRKRDIDILTDPFTLGFGIETIAAPSIVGKKPGKPPKSKIGKKLLKITDEAVESLGFSTRQMERTTSAETKAAQRAEAKKNILIKTGTRDDPFAVFLKDGKKVFVERELFERGVKSKSVRDKVKRGKTQKEKVDIFLKEIEKLKTKKVSVDFTDTLGDTKKPIRKVSVSQKQTTTQAQKLDLGIEQSFNSVLIGGTSFSGIFSGKQDQKSKQEQRSKSLIIQGQKSDVIQEKDTKITGITRIISGQTTKEDTNTRSLVVNVPRGGSGSSTRIGEGVIKLGKPGLPPFVPFFKLPKKGTIKRKKRKTKKRVQPKKFRRSLGVVVLGSKGVKKGSRLTGIEQRGEPVKKRKKTKRKTKKSNSINLGRMIK